MSFKPPPNSCSAISLNEIDKTLVKKICIKNATVFKTFISTFVIISLNKLMLCWQLFIPRYKSQTQQQNLKLCQARFQNRAKIPALAPKHSKKHHYMWEKRLHELFAR